MASAWVALRQWFLICASIIFYAWWDAPYVILPIAQIVATWLLTIAHKRSGRASWLVAGVALNLVSLGLFKYSNFLTSTINAIGGLELPRMSLALPIGISFFSFQLISYLVDRAREQAPIYPLRSFALFVLLYPHLIAGPIVRHNELIPQFKLDPCRDGMAARIAGGLVIFAVGLAKKVLLADQLALTVDPLFTRAAQQALDFGEAWTAALGFSLQLFLDFSAYTEMAIGTALVFGLTLPENFRTPYLATSIRDFWRRWHITLSNFLRDYLFIPFGGSKNAPWRFIIAILATMGLGGLWHGGGFTFVAWGLWHGVGLIVCRGWQQLRRPLPATISWAITMVFVLIGWVLFRADSFSTAGSILASLAGLSGFHGSVQQGYLIASAALVSVLVPSAHELKDHYLQPRPVLALAAALLAVFCVLESGRGPSVNFIYFQF
jgi:alginate O-acetyltransferase complex protein AlgI